MPSRSVCSFSRKSCPCTLSVGLVDLPVQRVKTCRFSSHRVRVALLYRLAVRPLRALDKTCGCASDELRCAASSSAHFSS